ncbi:hypothetical protein [Floridanema aerugineum]|uniref:Uncharacterized protein n=1 Tax=Floridaenema aerugineum BLCC-F46 TaxID=3153654 RepID=A0ABV4XG17_9CYAN
MQIHSNFADAHLIRGVSRFALGEQQQGIDDVQTAAQIYNNKGIKDRYELAQKWLNENNQTNIQSTPNNSSIDPCQERIDSLTSQLNQALGNLPGDPVGQMGVTNRREYHYMLQEARSLYTDPNCPSARQQIGTSFRSAWQTQIRAKREYRRIFTSSIKGQCDTTCSLSNIGGNPDNSCQDRCQQSYANELRSQDREYEIEMEEMDRFFSGR